MKSKILILLTLILFSCSDDDNLRLFEEVVVVANRANQSISFIDANSNDVIENLNIPNSEPMYVVYVPSKDRIYVGDRNQNKVHAINPNTREVETSINVGEGVFHMWAGGNGEQLWVNNDTDNTTSVINLNNNTVVQTIDLGIKPHDVFVTENGSGAYISVLAGDQEIADSIYAYNTNNYQRTASRAVGDDPHLYHIEENNRLYVPNQSGRLFVLDGDNLDVIANESLAGAHGIFPTPDNRHLIITNLPSGELYSFDTNSNSLTGSPLATTINIPHNVTINASGNKAFVTHSGSTANQVTIYTIDNGSLSLSETITVGNNPFGLAYYRREVQTP